MVAMRVACLVRFGLLVAVVPQPASSQERDRVDRHPPTPGREPSLQFKQRVRELSEPFQGPLRPVLRGVVAGGGPGVGLSYRAPLPESFAVRANAASTVRNFWSVSADAALRRGPLQLNVYARGREMPELDYFGSGPQSAKGARSVFGLRDGHAGALVALRLAPWLDVAARLERATASVDASPTSSTPGVGVRFGEAPAPGSVSQPRLRRSGVAVRVHVPPALGAGVFQGSRYRVSASRYDDRTRNRYAFLRIDVEGQQRFAVLGPERRLTLHAWASTTATHEGQAVPFYLQESLGGQGRLAGPLDELLGSDGTQATLRGFRDYRFRGRHLVLLQAEYRVPLWGPIDATAFVDAGKVTDRRAELDLDGLRRDYGVSLSVMRGPTTAARVDIALSGEGPRLLVGIGRQVQP